MLAKNQIKSRFSGTVGGVFWALAQPIATITIYYFVFTIGFRAHGPEGTVFVVWFICGLVPWFFFAETLQMVTQSVVDNSFLVKKTIFPTEALPMVGIITGTFTHAVFMVFLFILFAINDIAFSIERLLIFYYYACCCLLILGLGWFLASIQVFFRDVGHGLGVLLNMLFWLTPIVWYTEMIPEAYHFIAHANPIHYIIQGYRQTLVFDEVLLPSAGSTLYFWALTLSLLLGGGRLFQRLKQDFPDVI